jgi:hypothetical protein
MVLRIAIALVIVAVATVSSPLGARELHALSGTALQMVDGLSEPGTMLAWGSVLAALSHVLNRQHRRS